MSYVSQIELVSAILLHLEKKEKIKSVLPRQINKVIEAANIVVDAMAQEYRPATANMGISSWMGCDETGLSSKYMAHVLASPAGVLTQRAIDAGVICNRQQQEEKNFPHDPGDFGRCLGLLLAVPEMRPHIPLLADGHGQHWAALANHWDELESMYREELPSGVAPKLYARMQELFAKVEGGAA